MFTNVQTSGVLLIVACVVSAGVIYRAVMAGWQRYRLPKATGDIECDCCGYSVRSILEPHGFVEAEHANDAEWFELAKPVCPECGHGLTPAKIRSESVINPTVGVRRVHRVMLLACWGLWFASLLVPYIIDRVGVPVQGGIRHMATITGTSGTVTINTTASMRARRRVPFGSPTYSGWSADIAHDCITYSSTSEIRFRDGSMATLRIPSTYYGDPLGWFRAELVDTRGARSTTTDMPTIQEVENWLQACGLDRMHSEDATRVLHMQLHAGIGNPGALNVSANPIGAAAPPIWIYYLLTAIVIGGFVWLVEKLNQNLW